MRARLAITTALASLSIAACALDSTDDEGAQASLRENTAPIVYGNDDRTDLYAHPDTKLQDLAQSSVVALIPLDHFAREANGDSRLVTSTLTDAFQVCPDQRFADEITAADCSGVLIDDDLVLTAGHCFQRNDGSDCDHYAFMFDYFYRERHLLEPISWGNLYGCRRVVARSLTVRGVYPRIDFAVVQLDRKAIGRTPVTMRTTPLALGEEAVVIGCPSGLPLKIDRGGEVLDLREDTRDYFVLDSDTFEGSSGSGVFDTEGKLIGTLVRGGNDYVAIADGGCLVPNVVSTYAHDAGTPLPLLPDGGMIFAAAEEATYVARAIEGMCNAGWPSERLCGTEPRCGDGVCTLGETRDGCPADCACAPGACIDGGDYPAAHAVALEKNSGNDDDGCALSPGRARAAWVWSALGVFALRRARRRRATQI